MGDDSTDKLAATRGALIRAKNGDILRYDETGLVMVLADSVIDNIATRLAKPTSERSANDWIDPMVLGDVDAWDLRRDGEWLLFSANLPGAQGVRQFRRLAEPCSADIEPGIIADGAGPLRGVFSLGGPRRATGYEMALSYPWHVLAPADDLGAVGHAGEVPLGPQTALEKLPEATRDAVLADAIVARQHKNHKALSLFVTRCETDSSGSIAALAGGQAYENLLTAMCSLKAAADRLKRPATLYAIGLEYTLEDVSSDAITFRDGMFALLDQLTADIAGLRLRRPPVLALFDCGTHFVNDHPVLRAQWDLAWQGADHGLTYTAPGYMFKQDRYGRPDRAAVLDMADMEACALEVLHAGEAWFCPIFLLAEREDDPKKIRIRARAMSDLVIDTTDPFNAGKGAGFTLRGATNTPVLTHVQIASDDPQDVILTFDRAPEGKALEVLYAFGLTRDCRGIDFPQACGCLRDEWSFKSTNGTALHRWALPAVLPVW